METLGNNLVAKSGKKVAPNLNVKIATSYLLPHLVYGSIKRVVI